MSMTDSRFAPVEEMIHGILVRDPYRWLEDRGLPETEEWIRVQQRRCDEYFAECEELPAIRERVREYLDVEVVDQPAKIGDRYYYRRRNQGQEQGCIYVRDAFTGIERLLVDPSAEGPFVSVGIHRISSDGSLLAYECRHGGEDKKSIQIVNVETGATLPSRVERGDARGFSFSPKKRGFFYCQELSAEAEEHMIRFRSFDDPGTEQVLFSVARSRESRLALIADSIHLGAVWVHEVDGRSVADCWMAKGEDPTKWNEVFANRSLPFGAILKDGRLFGVSYADAGNGKLVEISRDGHEIRTIVPDQGAMITQFMMVGDEVYVTVIDGLRSSARVWSQCGRQLSDLKLPDDGTVRLFPDLGDGKSFFLSYESFSQPQMIFEYIRSNQQLSVWSQRMLRNPIVPTVMRNASYSALDGTEIPLTLVGRSETGEESTQPVVMTTYGGFGVAVTPQFSAFVHILIQCGALFVVPHTRGGGEFGRAWHDAARRRKKQTSFDDFTSAAEWLCREGITTPLQLAIFGGSNSGLLVGAAMTRRPDLFRVVLCIAPLLDMVRYEQFDNAAKWRDEYGTCESPDDFQALYAYSPYHQIREGETYPSILFVSGDKDDRCNSAHVRKMAARLLNNDRQAYPVVIDYSDERGHSPVLPLQVRTEALARRVAFLCRELNLPMIDGVRDEKACA